MEAAEILAQTVDKSQMPPLHQKRILAFVNHFLITSCNFLNKFAGNCEMKFLELERKIQRVEAALMILEAKLASIPDADLKATTSVEANKDEADKETDNAMETTTAMETNENSETAVSEVVELTPEPVGVMARNDARYKKFFKMLQFGVPAAAVKLKMQSEGVQPDILDTPNLLLADGTESTDS